MPRESKLPKQLQPMLATLIDAPFDSPDWVFESKWDGFRLVARIEKRSVTLYSRNGLVVSDNYKPIAKALEKMKRDAVIDGELVALDAHGISRFQLLQNALRTAANLHYCVFDIMFLDGEDLRGAAPARAQGAPEGDPAQGPAAHLQRALAGTRQALVQGGARSSASRASWPSAPQSRYLSGARSKDWLKIKTGKRQEVVIVGFTAPRRSRPLSGRWCSRCARARTGAMPATSALASRMRCSRSFTTSCGLAHATVALQAAGEGRGRHDLGQAQARGRGEVHRVDRRGEMRHPAFLGLREDKRAEDVVREKEAVSKRR